MEQEDPTLRHNLAVVGKHLLVLGATSEMWYRWPESGRVKPDPSDSSCHRADGKILARIGDWWACVVPQFTYRRSLVTSVPSLIGRNIEDTGRCLFQRLGGHAGG